jgi:hypothetical protein
MADRWRRLPHILCNIGSLIKISWPWLLVIGGHTLWSFSLGTAWQTAAMAAMRAKQPLPPQPAELLVISNLGNLIYFAGTQFWPSEGTDSCCLENGQGWLVI